MAVMLTAGTLWITTIPPFYLAVMLTAGPVWITPFYLAMMLTAGTFGYHSLLSYTLPLEHLDITPFYLITSITSFYLAVMLTAETL